MELTDDLSSLVLLPFFDLSAAVLDAVCDPVDAGFEDSREMVADALLREMGKFGAEAFVVACVQAEDVDDSLGVLEGH